MALGVFSAFYFGLTIDQTNRFLNFSEAAGPELTAEIEAGTYSLTDFLTAIKTALDNASTLPQVYTVTLDRDTRKITITSTGTFSLLISSGAQAASSAWSLMGFTGGSDLTGASTYESASGAGEEYITQFPLQDYIPGDNQQERLDASVNESADGSVEVVSYGVKKVYRMTFRYITDKPQDNKVIRSNLNGIADARNFFEKITNKGPFEFMEDVSNRSTFEKVILESTGTSVKGVGFRLRELTSQNLPGYYDINNVSMRVVE